jgi:hypothetical protein
MNKWIKVEDRLPTPYKDVLLYIPCNWGCSFDEGCMCVGSFDTINRCFIFDSVKDVQRLSDYINGEQTLKDKKTIKLINFPDVNDAQLATTNFDPSHWQELPKKPLINFHYIKKKGLLAKIFCKFKRFK